MRLGAFFFHQRKTFAHIFDKFHHRKWCTFVATVLEHAMQLFIFKKLNILSSGNSNEIQSNSMCPVHHFQCRHRQQNLTEHETKQPSRLFVGSRWHIPFGTMHTKVYSWLNKYKLIFIRTRSGYSHKLKCRFGAQTQPKPNEEKPIPPTDTHM